MTFELVRKDPRYLYLPDVSVLIGKNVIRFSRQALNHLRFKEKGVRLFYTEIYFDKDKNLLAFRKTKDVLMGYTLNRSNIQGRILVRRLNLPKGVFKGEFKDKMLIFDLNDLIK